MEHLTEAVSKAHGFKCQGVVKNNHEFMQKMILFGLVVTNV